MKKALITGINGQDGSYLAELLLAKGYEVHGVVRREAIEDPTHRLQNIAHIVDQITLHAGSVDSYMSAYKIMGKLKPDECYHLAASSFVSYSFDDEISVLSNNLNSAHFLLASIKELAPKCRFYYAGSSEMFGDVESYPQNETTRFNPRSIYGISKVSGYYLVQNYRRHYNIFACTGILYNHESPRRGYEFVTRKITSTVAKIHLGSNEKLMLGNIDARRDWGYSPEYVDAMWRMLGYDKPDDYVIATGETHTVRQFCEAAFREAGIEISWQGNGIDEKGIDASTGRDLVEIDSRHFRPTDVEVLMGDSSKAYEKLGWKPKVTFDELVGIMTRAEMELVSKMADGKFKTLR
jgi:GDPmannose 4,6-dehydratase